MSDDPMGVTNNGGEDFAKALQNMFSTSLARSLAAEGFYAMLKKRKQLKSNRVLTYRCPSRCLLLDVLNTRQGIIVHVPRYKNSPEKNAATSTEAGRLKNTEDGNGKWKGQTFFLEAAGNLQCNCDHVDQYVVTLKRLQADRKKAATRPEVIIRP